MMRSYIHLEIVLIGKLASVWCVLIGIFECSVLVSAIHSVVIAIHDTAVISQLIWNQNRRLVVCRGKVLIILRRRSVVSSWTVRS